MTQRKHACRWVNPVQVPSLISELGAKQEGHKKNQKWKTATATDEVLVEDKEDKEEEEEETIWRTVCYPPPCRCTSAPLARRRMIRAQRSRLHKREDLSLCYIALEYLVQQ